MRHGYRSALEEAVSALRQEARGEALATAMDAGTVHLARADYQGAVREASWALTVDPDDRTAQQFRWTAATVAGGSAIGVVPFGPRVAQARARSGAVRRVRALVQQERR